MVKFEIGTKYNNILTDKIIKTWDVNHENVILNGATGSGKTYFIEHNLYDYAKHRRKSILFLCNRKALFDNILLEKENLGLYEMDVLLYQTLETLIKDNEPIKQYDIICCDEFHYVISDGLFNVYTDITYDWLTIKNPQAIKIFMSGTALDIFKKLKEDNIVKPEFEYIIPYDYSYATLISYKNKSNVFDIINHVINETDEKIIYFANSIDMALAVYKQFKEFATLKVSNDCADKEAKKYNTEKCIQAYSKDLITFKSRLMVCTKVLDNGIDIIDSKLKHIISDIFDLESCQQSLGRKRIIDNTDTCNFYVMDYSKKYLGQFKGGNTTKLKPLETFINDKENFYNEYAKNRKFHSDYIYSDKDGQLTYNKLAYWKLTLNKEMIELMQDNSYIEEFKKRLGDTINIGVYDSNLIGEYEMKDELCMYLEELADDNVMLFKDEQQDLINAIDLKDKRNRQQSSIRQLNSYIQEHYEMSIVSCRDRRKIIDNKRNKNYDKTYWKIVKGISK